MNPSKQKSIWQQPLWVAVLAFTAAFAWGWAYPLIKLGFAEFGITASQTGSKMLFAGVRFAISGLLILLMAKATHREFRMRTGPRGRAWILVFALLNTAIHYACFYIGLSHSAGSRAAILNSLSVFALVLLACAVYPSTDRLTGSKVAGCVLGFVGIMALNMGGACHSGHTGRGLPCRGHAMGNMHFVDAHCHIHNWIRTLQQIAQLQFGGESGDFQFAHSRDWCREQLCLPWRALLLEIRPCRRARRQRHLRHQPRKKISQNLWQAPSGYPNCSPPKKMIAVGEGRLRQISSFILYHLSNTLTENSINY